MIAVHFLFLLLRRHGRPRPDARLPNSRSNCVAHLLLRPLLVGVGARPRGLADRHDLRRAAGQLAGSGRLAQHVVLRRQRLATP